MTTILLYSSAAFSGLLGLTVVLLGRRSTANLLFFAGMMGLAASRLLDGMALKAADFKDMVVLEGAALFVRAFVPGIWLAFSLTFSRGNYREFLARWRLLLAASFIIPFILTVTFQEDLVQAIQIRDNGNAYWLRMGITGQALMACSLIISVLILMNLEKTFRTAVGTMRWRIKLMVVGLCVIFGVRIFTASQALLYSGINLSFSAIDGTALLLGCALITLSYLRSGRSEIDVYPSQAFLYSSIAVVAAGVYLLAVGLLARLIAFLGGDTAFPIKAFFMLLGTVGLAMIFLSDRIRQRTKRFVSRHFQRPLYDYRNVWRSFTEGTTSRVEQTDMCRAVVTFISNLFQVLSVTIWLTDGKREKIAFAASTSIPDEDGIRLQPDDKDAPAVLQALRNHPEPVDIDTSEEDWAETLRRCTPDEFHKGGHRLVVPLVAGGELLGLITLGDRVSGIPFSIQDTDLLKCICDQAAASLRNIQLSQRLIQAREMEAFQTMSAFFVHDLKNTASTLSLMLRNLPVHFNDPAFREDALRGISSTVNHINSLIERLSLLRQGGLTIRPVPSNLTELVEKVLKDLNGLADTKVIPDLRPVPKVAIDVEQVQKVITNLILNAREAVGRDGEIRIQTGSDGSWTTLTVSDNGCGMSADFMDRSLFRPFQTTKKKGIGIGMFQSKMIVEAHRGRIEVQSELGKGTTFRVLLPQQVI
ncbi:MAG TPA: XrtA/PEP-CTERM system histidine kinase PrsK [Candidatus Paceibacterota bacterium]|nr:XrtA/PEP-CTERM system histidine kinase PrsK [Candidatus Paceibacterota bacterium]